MRQSLPLRHFAQGAHPGFWPRSKENSKLFPNSPRGEKKNKNSDHEGLVLNLLINLKADTDEFYLLLLSIINKEIAH